MNSHHDVDIVLFLVWKNERLKAVVVTQLAKWSLPTPDVRSSNPVIGKVFIEHC